jgi:predicted HAD superfamily Cof-like phosphohydrolase
MKYYTREQKVREFHEAMGLDVASQPRVSLLDLRYRLLHEEWYEVCQELDELTMELERGKPGTKEQWAALLKELADLQYVLSGTIVSLGPLAGGFDTAFNRVHLSNMSKLGDDGKPVYREDGKVTKGPNYEPPTLEDLIK